MILVDTSVWIDHFRSTDVALAALLERDEVVCHPYVIGEIALGGAALDTEPVLSLTSLPQLPALAHEDVMAFAKGAGLPGSGVGYVDAHLLAALAAEPGRSPLWTRDRRLAAVAGRLDLLAEPT